MSETIHIEAKTSNKQQYEEEQPIPKEWPLFYYVLPFCIFSFFWNVVTVFTPSPVGTLLPSDEIDGGCEDGLSYCTCPRETVCVTNTISVILLFIARGGAYFTYPLYVLLFLTKAHNLINWLHGTLLVFYIPFHDMHNLHVTCGMFAAYDVIQHSVLHTIRWALEGDLELLWTTQTGITGLICWALTFFIAWPMIFEPLKKKLSFEWRKLMHYLSVIWGISLAFHAPARHIFWVIGIPVAIYLVDFAIGCLVTTFLVPNVEFHRLKSATYISFQAPKGFCLDHTSYCLIMLPWLDNKEWHAFTIYPHTRKEGWVSICAACTGKDDSWTRRLHQEITRPDIIRPACVSGPFLSPYATAMNYDNVVAVASGIGITPALSLITLFSLTRRIHLIWMCRDSSLIEFFIDQIHENCREHAFILIYYTGMSPLNIDSQSLPDNVFIFNERPNLKKSVIGVIYSIESGEALPESLVQKGTILKETTPLRRFYGTMINSFSYYKREELVRSLFGSNTDEEAFSNRILSSTATARSTSMKKSSMMIKMSRRQPFQKLSLGKPTSYDKRLSFVDLMTQMKKLFDNDDLFDIGRPILLDLFNSANEGSKGLNRIGLEVFLDDLLEIIDDALQVEEVSQNVRALMDIDEGDALPNIDKNSTDVEALVVASRPPQTNFQRLKSAEEGVKRAKARFSTVDNDIESKDKERASQLVLENRAKWSLLYCGGSAPVVVALDEINKEYGVDLRVEKFDW